MHHTGQASRPHAVPVGSNYAEQLRKLLLIKMEAFSGWSSLESLKHGCAQRSLILAGSANQGTLVILFLNPTLQERSLEPTGLARPVNFYIVSRSRDLLHLVHKCCIACLMPMAVTPDFPAPLGISVSGTSPKLG